MLLQLQLVAETSVKLVAQAVQVVELAQALQLLMAAEQRLHCPEPRYSVVLQLQLVPE